MDPIVITSQEVAQTQIPVQGAPEVRPRVPNPVPLWARLLLVPLILILPLLCLVALILRVSVRSHAPRVRQSWAASLLTLVIISGLFSTILTVLFVCLSWAPAPDAISSALSDLDERGSFPALPTSRIMSGVELSSTLKPLVLLASPGAKRWFQESYGTSGLLGAALILHVDSHGYLLATPRHVADGEGWKTHRGPQKAMGSVGMNGWGGAQGVGRREGFDAAMPGLRRHLRA